MHVRTVYFQQEVLKHTIKSTKYRNLNYPHLNEPVQRIFFPVALRPNAGQGHVILDIFRSHTTKHLSRYDFSGRVISSSQRPLPDNLRLSKQANVHTSGGIQTQNLSRRAAADLRLRLRCQWVRLFHEYAQ